MAGYAAARDPAQLDPRAPARARLPAVLGLALDGQPRLPDPERDHGLAGLRPLAAHTSMSVISAFNVSLIGLVTFAPLFFLALPAAKPPTGTTGAGAAASAMPARSPPWPCWFGRPSTAGPRCRSCSGVAVLFGASRAFFSPAMTAPWRPCWCRERCCRAPSPGTPWPGSRPPSPARRWAACSSRFRPASPTA